MEEARGVERLLYETMIIFDTDATIECGVNDDGVLFLGDDTCGYNLIDTPENRERILIDFSL